jgi:hypothetical protein
MQVLQDVFIADDDITPIFYLAHSQIIFRVQKKGIAPDSDAYSAVLRVCSRSSMHLQAMCNFSGARSLLDHVVGIHAGMVESSVQISSGAALIAASAHQVLLCSSVAILLFPSERIVPSFR